MLILKLPYPSLDWLPLEGTAITRIRKRLVAINNVTLDEKTASNELISAVNCRSSEMHMPDMPNPRRYV